MSSSVLFEKPIEEINLRDIKRLRTRQVAEGLYIEYKSNFPSAKKISHSIASFANMHGGWYFVGIKADENNVPDEFCGFDLSVNTKPKEKVRDTIVGNINPIPLFHSKLLKLEDNKGILAVHIPESFETPHITRDGRVYRRHGEGSDPIPETDRYAIDKLYERGKRFDDMVENFCQNEFVISKAQEEQGWLEVYFMTYPLNKLHIQDFFETKYVDEISKFFKDNIKLYDAISMGIPFDNVSTSFDSLILRQTTPETLLYLTLTFQYFRNGDAKIVIPFQYLNLSSLPEIYESSESIKKLNSIIRSKDELSGLYRMHAYRVIDGWKIYNVYLVLVGKYIELLKKSNWKDFVLTRYRLVNTWRHTLFFDSDIYVNHLDKFGLPICLKDEADVPQLPTKNFLKDKVPDKNTGLSGQFALLAECLGFSPAVFVEMIKDWLGYIKKTGTKPKD